MAAFLYFFLGIFAFSETPLASASDIARIEDALLQKYPGASDVQLFSQKGYTQACFKDAQRVSTAIFDQDGQWQGTCQEVMAAEVPQGVVRESRHDLMDTPTRYFKLTSPHTYAPVYISYLLVKSRFPFLFPANGILSVQLMTPNVEAYHLVDREGLMPAFRMSGVWMGGAYHASGRPLTHQTLRELLGLHLVPALPSQVAFPVSPDECAGFYSGYKTCP
ncbi:MAG: hypothetical protein AAFV07_10975 [Bacteroidota bacterium]